MIDFCSILRALDLFSYEPQVLTFGDPKKPNSRNMYKTSCGGLTTILTVGLAISYFSLLITKVTSDESLKWETMSKAIHPISLGRVTLEDAKLVPQIAMLGKDLYMRNITDDYKRYFWIGMTQVEGTVQN